MQRGLETSLVQAWDECESDVTETDLSCCSQLVNVFCLNMSQILCNRHPETTFSFGGDDVVGKCIMQPTGRVVSERARDASVTPSERYMYTSEMDFGIIVVIIDGCNDCIRIVICKCIHE